MQGIQEEQKEVGSYKKLGDVTLCTRRMFHSGEVKIFETVEGDFVLASGEPVNDKSLLSLLPEPHKTRAFAWFDKANAPKEPVPVPPPAAKAAPATGEGEICPICQRTFKNKLSLTTHMRVHGKEKPA